MSAAVVVTLSELIRSVLAETDLVSPDEVADEVVRRTPADRMREFYRESVRERARVQMHGIPTSSPGHTMRDTQMGTAGAAPKPSEPVRSAKFRAIADMHQQQLAARVHVGDEWKMFGQCSYDDLMDLIDDREARAAENAAKAEQFRRVAKEMANLKADTVADLPAPVLDAALRGES